MVMDWQAGRERYELQCWGDRKRLQRGTVASPTWVELIRVQNDAPRVYQVLIFAENKSNLAVSVNYQYALGNGRIVIPFTNQVKLNPGDSGVIANDQVPARAVAMQAFYECFLGDAEVWLSASIAPYAWAGM